MKIVIVGSLLILGIFKVCGADGTNNPYAFSLRGMPLEKLQSEEFGRKSAFLKLLDNRLLFTFTNSFGSYRLVEFEREQNRLGIDYSEYVARQARNAFSRSARLALREFALEEIPFVYEVKTSWASAIRNTLTGYEEKENPVSPLDPREGLPAQEGIRQPKGLKLTWRPLRTDPYASLSYGKYDTDGQRIFTTSLRLYADDWQIPKSTLIAELPLYYGFSLSSGINVRPFEEDKLRVVEGTIGLVKVWRQGELYVGGSYPAGFLASLRFSW